MLLEKTLESPLDCKKIQSVYPKGDQSWVFIGRTDDEAETPVLWPPHVKSWLIGKYCDAGRDWGQEEKGMTEDENGWMVSPTQWIWVCVNSGNWLRTGRPGVLRSLGSQRVGNDWATELNWTGGPNIPGWSMQYCSLQHWTLLPSPVTSICRCCFHFRFLFSLSGVIFPLFSSSLLVTFQFGGFYLSVSYLFAFSYCSWSSQRKNIEVDCHSLLQWTIFGRNSPPWPILIWWLDKAWLIVSFS